MGIKADIRNIIITRKIEVRLHHDPITDPQKEKYNQQWETWRKINNHLYLAANRISSHLFFNDEYEHRLQISNPRYKEIKNKLSRSEKEKLTDEEIKALKAEQKELNKKFKEQKKEFLGGTSEQNSTYQIASDEFITYIPAEILTCLNQNIVSTYNNYQNDVANGIRSIPNYKKGMPIPFSIKKNKQLQLHKREDGSIYLTFPKGLVWNLHFGKDPSNNKEIVERILSGTYDVGNSDLQEKKNKIFLLLKIKIPKLSQQLDETKIVGIDLGINIPLYAALNDNEYNGIAIGSRDKFLKERERFEKQYKELQSSLLYSTQGGRGRKHKLQALERFNEKERNWVHTQNHIFSKAVIEYAKVNHAGIIQMENLSNFGHEAKDKFKYILRHWSYYELQTMIEYKALRENIKVRYVNPYHTSQKCSFCGHYEEGLRISQTTFICKNPECKKGKGKQLSDGSYQGINADWNAARNIALSADFKK